MMTVSYLILFYLIFLQLISTMPSTVFRYQNFFGGKNKTSSTKKRESVDVLEEEEGDEDLDNQVCFHFCYVFFIELSFICIVV